MSRQRNRRPTDKPTNKPAETPAAVAVPEDRADEHAAEMAADAVKSAQAKAAEVGQAAAAAMTNMPAVDTPTSGREVPFGSDIIQAEICAPMAAAEPRGYVCNRLDAHLTRDQAVAVWRLREALGRYGYRLANGRFVHTAADAVRWLLELISEAAADKPTVAAEMAAAADFANPALGMPWSDAADNAAGHQVQEPTEE